MNGEPIDELLFLVPIYTILIITSFQCGARLANGETEIWLLTIIQGF